MDDLIYSSAIDLAAAVRSKRVSAVELTQAFLSRISAVNPALNAVVQCREEGAIADARLADDALARGDDVGLLHGVPMTLKDCFETRGVITTAGTTGLAGHVPERDATVTARLRRAGAILLGKTSVPEILLRFATDNYVYGRTNNPYALDRTPAGSSGGAAAIVAAGGAAFDIGSDAGGSVRVPAHLRSPASRPAGGSAHRAHPFPARGARGLSARTAGPARDRAILRVRAPQPTPTPARRRGRSATPRVAHGIVTTRRPHRRPDAPPPRRWRGSGPGSPRRWLDA